MADEGDDYDWGGTTTVTAPTIDWGGGNSSDLNIDWNNWGATLNPSNGFSLTGDSPGFNADPTALGPGAGGGGGGFNLQSILAALGGGKGGGAGGSGNLLQALLGLGGGIYGLSKGNALTSAGNRAIADSNPFGPYRAQYAQMLAQIMADPSSITSQPGYKFQLDQGAESVARGMGPNQGSGREGAALTQYGQDFASNYLQTYENQLATLAGANITPNPGPGLNAIAGGTNIDSASLNSIGAGLSALTGQGGASAGGTSGQAAQLAAIIAAMGGGGTAGVANQGRPTGGFNSAGGVAAIAQDASLAGKGLGVESQIAKLGGYTNPDWVKGVGTDLGILNNVYGVYSGLEKGGWQGDVGAAANAGMAFSGVSNAMAQAGYGSLEGAGAVAQIAGPVAAALSVYNFAENWQSGDTGGDALRGAEAGASVGTAILPGVGTLVGGVIGGAAGAISSAFGPGKEDPENANWDSYAHAFDTHGAAGVAGATPSQSFQALSGIFDARGSSIPFYQKYGRMGESAFMDDMTKQINAALQSGAISATDSPATIYSKVVNPWINAMSPGGWTDANTVKGDPTKGAVQNLLTSLIGNYTSGQLTSTSRLGVSGQTITGLQNWAGPVQPLQTTAPPPGTPNAGIPPANIIASLGQGRNMAQQNLRRG